MSLPFFQEEPACAQMCPNLSYQHRLIGFVSCAFIGWLLSFIGTLTLIGGFTTENVRTFAALYVVGNLIALAATGFLIGPKSQCIKMWAVTRRFTTAFYLIMLIVVFIVAVMKQNIFLVLFLLFVEVLAAVWYSISYIPFGRKIVLQFFRSTGACFPCFYISDQADELYKKHGPKPASTTPSVPNPFASSSSSSSSSSKSMSASLFGSGK
jgi:hypothetical protein